MDKIDARRLSSDGRVMLRKMVIRLRQQAKLPVKELAAVAGVHVRTVETWLARARRDGEGSLDGEKKRGRPVGACRKLTLADELWLRDQIVGQTPGQMQLPFALWTRPAIKALVKARFAVDMQDRLVGKYLKRWGFTPQRPVKRALEQDPVKVKTWLEETWPQVLARARAEGATVLWGDETAVKEDAHWVRGYAPRGKTPVLKMRTRWDKLSMISAISARGQIAFQIVEGTINAECFLAFLELLLQDARQKIFLVVDNLRVHHAKPVTAWLADKQDRIELVFLPPYAPESNPDEYLNRDFKTALRSGPVSHDKTSLLEKASAFMHQLASWPEHVMAYFRHPSAAYAAQGI
jgi:transposase